ncbi:TPM domain-containing protein [Dyadobacter subterraneus]|uniref:TPM domain-containing protein n=1 Tax=Dyadobacter subterraneus TaxID=2773304 RepID=A0ABR9WIN0_9BACT|nr:TPM domain-containing protein [Dyadobacter subterraneus]MBE9465374.1 TPM domain-containing protein [Dyadobacter subterraneus]
MKKYIIFSFMFLFVLCRVVAQDVPAKPNPPRLVNDFAKQLNPTEISALEQKLDAYNDSTSSQIAIVVVPTTGDYPIADYALKLGREWGVGGKGKNNGIVILWASTDRKIYISTGYGMEGAVPDAIAKRIITQVMTPEFKNGMYYRGLDKGVDMIIKYATGEYKADAKQVDDGESGGTSPLLILVVVFIIIVFIISRNKGGGGGGFRNMGGGPIFFPYTTHSSGGSSSGNWGGGFGGGDGGGFGGFGGGSFGGGGAGGDY